ncbi:MAG: sigma 54-interacting transcriptional regulator [Deltaproteobacteria bacterium]|jgi:PAS domain S-box-containing protein|nr:sigma 54-interacting transcriptional regulator [Deltaproteobacteria bacterium]
MADKTPDNETEIILESISDGVFTVDKEWQIMSFNKAAENITGVSRKEAIGRHCWEVFRSNMCEKDCALKRTMKKGKAFTSSSTYLINKEKKKVPISISTALLRNGKGEVLGGVETFRDLSVVTELRKELESRFKIGDIVSCSSSMQKIFNTLPQIAESDSTVLIQGETGTGKELLAKAIHNLSNRVKKPFVAINCGALPDTLLESELFGYKAGAFTHAVKDKPGYFAAAKGGTIFLDEIGDTSPAFQVRLLRVLEEKEFKPLGSVTPVKTDVRILTATNKDLFKMVETGEFRQDLYYRINIVRLEIPSLVNRKNDVPILVDHFISRMNKLKGKQIESVDNEVMEVLMNHHFPGNIRELENIIEHAFILCTEKNIQLKHLPESLTPIKEPAQNRQTLDDSRDTNETSVILDALKRNDHNRQATAKDLGIHKSTLFRKIKKLNINLPETDGRYKK